jgi:predicted amidohydrolase
MLGEQLVSPTEFEGTYIATLDKEKLNQTRVKLNFLNDQDTFEIKN